MALNHIRSDACAVFYFGDGDAPITETDVILGDSGLRTNKPKGTLQMDEVFGPTWSQHPNRGRACVLICFSGAVLSQLIDVLKFFSNAKNLAVFTNVHTDTLAPGPTQKGMLFFFVFCQVCCYIPPYSSNERFLHFVCFSIFQ